MLENKVDKRTLHKRLLLQFEKYSERFLLAVVERLDGDDSGLGYSCV